MTPTEMILTTEFHSLFQGRSDVWFDCIKDVRGGMHYSRKHNAMVEDYEGSSSLTFDRLVDHLFGEQPIGAYNLRSDSTVMWSATDIDVENLDWALWLMDVWYYYGMNPIIERSRSKGYHLWLFHPEPVEAETARKAWQWVHQVAEVPATEVYPKQVKGEKTFGNCIRLPYGNYRNEGRQCFIWVDGDGEIYELDLRDAIKAGKEARDKTVFISDGTTLYPATQDRMELVARRGCPPEVSELSTQRVDARAVGQFIFASNQPIHYVYSGEEMVKPGSRDNTFFTLVKFCYGIGHSKKEVMEICQRVYDRQCPDKYDFDWRVVEQKVERGEQYA